MRNEAPAPTPRPSGASDAGRDAASVWLAQEDMARAAQARPHTTKRGKELRRRSKPRVARRVPADIRDCWGQVRRENLLWDVPRIHRDVLEPGVETTQSPAMSRTVAPALASHRAIYDVVAH